MKQRIDFTVTIPSWVDFDHAVAKIMDSYRSLLKKKKQITIHLLKRIFSSGDRYPICVYEPAYNHQMIFQSSDQYHLIVGFKHERR